MANFKGHALPGSFFLVFGLWWSVKYPLRYLSQKASKKSQNNYCFQRMDAIEGGVKITFAVIGKSYVELTMPTASHAVAMTIMESSLQRNWSGCGRMHLLDAHLVLTDQISHPFPKLSYH